MRGTLGSPHSLLTAMHLPLLLSVFTVTTGMTAGQVAGIKHTTYTKAVHDYLDRLAPASKNAILHELMGPTVGSDVSLYGSPHGSILIRFFFLFSHLAGGHGSGRPRSRSSRVYCILGQGWLSCVSYVA